MSKFILKVGEFYNDKFHVTNTHSLKPGRTTVNDKLKSYDSPAYNRAELFLKEDEEVLVAVFKQECIEQEDHSYLLWTIQEE